ncbi:hypothetical protein G6F37_006076 [Rhizopus arrhizus]|nr:hypothetical protein G6F38_006232 [Rhizopus arrhizus]KAG1158129.1 hypothetical protein G6F37_006076 [Rhizopus arrhizus]
MTDKESLLLVSLLLQPFKLENTDIPELLEDEENLYENYLTSQLELEEDKTNDTVMYQYNQIALDNKLYFQFDFKELQVNEITLQSSQEKTQIEAIGLPQTKDQTITELPELYPLDAELLQGLSCLESRNFIEEEIDFSLVHQALILGDDEVSFLLDLTST